MDLVGPDLVCFLSPEADPDALLTAVSELKAAAALGTLETKEPYSWMSEASEQDRRAPFNADSAAAAPPKGQVDEKEPRIREGGKASAHIQSDLKPTASEFQPSFAPRSRVASGNEGQAANGLLSSMHALNVGDDALGGVHSEPPPWNEGINAYEGNFAQRSQACGVSSHFTPPGMPVSAASEDAALSVLSQQFPEYSPAALASIFDQCGRRLPSALQMLFSMEAELTGQLHAGYVMPAASAPPAPSEPAFSNDDFPTLGGPPSTSNRHSKAAVVPFGANYAGKAKAAAALPTPAASRKPANPNGQSSAAWGGGGVEKPVWESGVQKFATGASVAAEYAERRADARDHARLRNQCFQNATQAYLAGNKALAKELGAKGRWHNEQMKALHASAAADTFSARNAAALGGSGGGQRDGGPPTIDLHGLHVSEAVHHLEAAFEELRGQGVRSVHVVVGVGQHGKVPSRLPGAVRSFLSERGLPFRESYAGLLAVTLR